MTNVRSGVFALLLALAACLWVQPSLADTVPVPAPLPSLPAGGQIPPPGPAGCLCRCQGEPNSAAEKWFCRNPCEAIAEGVTLVDLTTWVDQNCFPMRAGVDPLECVSCLEETTSCCTAWMRTSTATIPTRWITPGTI